jgi:hypothetical protein
MSTWILWFGIVLLLAGSLSAGYVWYGKILGIVKKERAKKIWIGGMALVVIGFILMFAPIISGILPEETEAAEKAADVWLPFFWVAIATVLIGAIPIGLAQYRILDSIRLETTVKVFKIGFVIMSIGSIMLLWVMMPGHMLP